MEKLNLLHKKYSMLQRAYARFNESVDNLKKHQNLDSYEVYRDSAIKRFEFTFDPLWKFLRAYISFTYDISIKEPGPKATYRQLRSMDFLTESELLLCIAMVDNRNQTAHDYDEVEIEDISHQLPEYCTIIGTILDKINLPKNNETL